jgi:hypothetical protein
MIAEFESAMMLRFASHLAQMAVVFAKFRQMVAAFVDFEERVYLLEKVDFEVFAQVWTVYDRRESHPQSRNSTRCALDEVFASCRDSDLSAFGASSEAQADR